MTMTLLVYSMSVMKNETKKFTIDEICALVEMNKRTVRYYIQKGLVDRPEGRKDHATPTPLGGGVAIYVGFWIPVWLGAAGAALVANGWQPSWLPERMQELAAGVAHVRIRLIAIFVGTTIIAAIGLADDRWGLPAWPRLAVQIGVSLGMFLAGVRITVFHESPIISALITIVWFVVTPCWMGREVQSADPEAINPV